MTARARSRLLTLWEDARYFWTRRIWDAQLEQLTRHRALAYRAARLVHGVAHGLLFSDRLHVRAAALTYYTVLSLVPVLAFAFALLKGFGAYEALVQEIVRPFVLDTFAGNRALQQAFEQVLDFVSATNVASLGFVGLIVLLYTATRLLRSIEGALNDLWEARSARTPLQQLRDYVAAIVVTPLCLLLAASVGTLTQLIEVLRSLQEELGLGGLLDWAFGTFAPLFVAFVGLSFLYRVMPNAPVRTRSALVGAALGALLWYGALVIHVRFQVGVARFNALYAGFGAIPIFLVWLNVSWLAVMIGAEVAATHQHEQERVERRRAAQASLPLREAVCISAMLRIARALLCGDPPQSLGDLARALEVPAPLVRELLERMAAADLLRRSGPERDPQWLLARLPEDVRVKDLLDALHGTAPSQRFALEEHGGMHEQAIVVLRKVDAELAASPTNRTLRELLHGV